MQCVIRYNCYITSIESWVELNEKWNKRFPSRRDYQRQWVYNFESYMINRIDHSLNYTLETEGDVIRLYQYIYALLGISEKTLPSVKISRQNKTTSSHRSWIIKLAEGWGQKLKVVLHELAHDIVDTMKEKESSVDHGETFVSVILALYEYFIPEWDKILAFSELERRKIKWSEVDYNRMIDALAGIQPLPVAENLSVDRSMALQKFIG